MGKYVRRLGVESHSGAPVVPGRGRKSWGIRARLGGERRAATVTTSTESGMRASGFCLHPGH